VRYRLVLDGRLLASHHQTVRASHVKQGCERNYKETAMKLSRTAPMISLLALLAALLAPISAFAQPAAPYPSKPIRFIVPFPPGGGGDIVARLIGTRLADALNNPVVVDNKPGAQGNIGAGLGARAPADGYTLLFGHSGTHAINPTLYAQVPFKESDFQPVIWMMNVPQIATLSSSVQANGVQEFISLVKRNPGSMNFGSAGAIQQLAGELLNAQAGVKITHVPYKGGAAMVNALLGGEIQLAFLDPANVVQTVPTGKVKPIAVASQKRSKIFPDLPTLSEAGLPGFEVTSWNGLLVPAGTPRDIVNRLNAEVNKILTSPEMTARLSVLGYEPVGGTPEQFTSHISQETAKWGKIVRDAKMSAE